MLRLIHQLLFAGGIESSGVTGLRIASDDSRPTVPASTNPCHQFAVVPIVSGCADPVLFVSRRCMWIKICGIRDIDTARYLADLGVDAIGLNFYAPSPRSVTIEQAKQIAAAVRGRTTIVGLFVNHSVQEVRDVIDQVGLDMLQFHGDEPPEFLAEFPDFRIVRAFRMGADGLAPVAEYLQRGRKLNAMPWACLIDAAAPGQYGGTGSTVDWQRLNESFHGGWPALIIAGGLTPDNVAEAIKVTHPWGVDVASGVEAARGVKDRTLIKNFVESARKPTKPQDDI